MDGWVDEWMDMDGRTDGWTEGGRDGWTMGGREGWMNGWMNAWIWMDGGRGWTDGRTDGRMDLFRWNWDYVKKKLIKIKLI